MSALGLTVEQLAERKLRLHAGDAGKVMEGRYREVWQRFQPGYRPEDLSGEFRVMLGSYTEPFGLWWTEKTTRREIQYFSDNPLLRHVWHALTGREARGELRVSPDYPFLACNLDALTTTPQGREAVLDAKHLGRIGEAEILRYTPAGVWQATVMGADWWGIAPIVGNKWQEPIFQEVDPLYQAELIARARECWGFIERGEEPQDHAEPVPPPKPQPKLRQIDLDLLPDALRPNWYGEFAKLARTFAETKGAFDLHAITRENLKQLVPEDIGSAKLGLVRFKRDNRGVSISLDKGADQ
jgi:hypothetical protein